jgi:hypothetical protein
MLEPKRQSYTYDWKLSDRRIPSTVSRKE